jgi:hypothetical protein
MEMELDDDLIGSEDEDASGNIKSMRVCDLVSPPPPLQTHTHTHTHTHTYTHTHEHTHFDIYIYIYMNQSITLCALCVTRQTALDAMLKEPLLRDKAGLITTSLLGMPSNAELVTGAS